MNEQRMTGTMEERVLHALEICRPYLRADGGDAELVSIAGDGVVEVRFAGTCVNCPLSKMTLRAGIERTIMYYAPEVKRVELTTGNVPIS